jgi:hypothetical protein
MGLKERLKLLNGAPNARDPVWAGLDALKHIGECPVCAKPLLGWELRTYEYPVNGPPFAVLFRHRKPTQNCLFVIPDDDAEFTEIVLGWVDALGVAAAVSEPFREPPGIRCACGHYIHAAVCGCGCHIGITT